MRYFQLKNSKAKGKRQKKIFFGFENLLVLTCGWYFKWWSVAVKFNFRFILQLFALLCHKNVFFLVNESMNWIYGDWFWLQIVGCLFEDHKKEKIKGSDPLWWVFSTMARSFYAKLTKNLNKFGQSFRKTPSDPIFHIIPWLL